jgi:YD repeat-containing protein
MSTTPRGVTRHTQADGTFDQFAYTVNGQGKVTQSDVTDPKGNVRRVTFNAAGYPPTDTRAYGTVVAQTTTYTRDATSGLVTSMTDALGWQTAYTYDAQGNVLTWTCPAAPLWPASSASADRRCTLTDPRSSAQDWSR